MTSQPEMTADTFEDLLLAAFPALAPDLGDVREWWGDDNPGLHIVVGDVLAPYVIGAVDGDDADRLAKSLAFLERMATSGDDDLRNALTVSLLETLGDDPGRLQKARASMGHETLALSHVIERQLGREG